MRTTRIGSGAGFAGDRFEPAEVLVRHAGLADLVLECLAERTIALGQQRRLTDPAAGYDPRLLARFRRLLPLAAEHGVRVLSNMGAANPLAAGRATAALLDELGLDRGVAVVTGDDVLDRIDPRTPALEDGVPLEEHGELVSANAYLGADAIMPALGADVVLTGRVADPSLFLAPLADRLGWDLADPPRAAAGTLIGHLLECAGQLTGGYFADPGRKEVPGLAELGFPFADVTADGAAVFGKPDGTGGLVTRATVREQLLYEITDPTAYLTPDVELDLREVTVRETGPDRVAVRGAIGRARPPRLKVSVGYRAGFRAEAEISYEGPNSRERAALAGEIVTKRLPAPPRIQLSTSDHESRLRVAALTRDRDAAEAVCHEVEALYTNGPAGGGGVRTSTTEVIGIVSVLADREIAEPAVTTFGPVR
ncbi:acyclic terpene utilization AtuA family protein [Amycolatopsis albispora]|uniref:ABC transporter substrate-binding protein n=1 Tax=Amycolatopsis albispora TaxID=1804986 RepID=A0A344L570_9PSEU|nr:acyclic terpene utilization AtuA family protein [Amycolatopsis albispora]AXB43194.1 ABC transporter substrate-binding protein [Amycolatopsis albispora]